MSRRRPHVYSFRALMDRLGSGVWCVMEINDNYVFVAKQHRDYGRPK
jgi:hypothetical protein